MAEHVANTMPDWMSNLPAELTEADLTGMVEGTLPPEREAVAIAALKAEPRLGLLIKSLRNDREQSRQGAAEMDAPADVRSGVLAAIDRRVIRELDEQAQQNARVPVAAPVMVIRETGGWESFLQGRGARRLAIAAGLVLAAGAAVYITLVLVPTLGVKQYPELPLATGPDVGTPANSTGGTAATEPARAERGPDRAVDRAAEPDAIARTTPVAPQPPVISDAGEGPSMALETVDPTAPARPDDAVAANTGADAGEPEATGANAVIPETPAATPTETQVAGVGGPDMSLDAIETPVHTSPARPESGALSVGLAQASRLARDGRLAVVIRGGGAELRREVERLADGARPSGEGAMGTLVQILPGPTQTMPGPVIALRDQIDAQSLSVPTGGRPARDPGAIASDGPGGTRERVTPVQRPSGVDVGLPAGAGTALFWARLEPRESVLEAWKAGIEALGPGARLEFVALPEGTQAPISWEPEAILWWQGSVGVWGRTARVPVLMADE